MDGTDFSKPLYAADAADFKRIYDEAMQMLYKIAYRIVNDEEAAEDLAHEKQLQFPSINDAKYWLIRVVKNASLNYVKRKTRERKAYQKALYEDRRKVLSGETEVLQLESIKTAREALNKLPPKLKEVIVLKEYGDMNYKDIGKALGITEGNVKVRVFRARKLLEEMLGRDDVYLPN